MKFFLSVFVLLLASVAVQADPIQCGISSWYGSELHGNRTASGERFNKNDLTAAHRSLPMGTVVTVVNQNTGKEVVVRINDRGPFHGGRILDLSEAAASIVGIKRAGTGKVCLY